MANLLKRSGGYKAVQYKHPEGRRRTVAVGKLTVRQANAVATKIESLAASVASGAPLDMETAGWIGGIGDDLHGRLAEQGLVQPRGTETIPTLGAIIAEFKEARTDVKPKTRLVWKQAFGSLTEHFGQDYKFADITEGKAMDFEQWLIAYKRKSGRGYAAATIRKRIGVAKMLWRWAVKHDYVRSNVFDDLRSAAVATTRTHQVTPKEAAAVIDACPDAQWRALVALSRYAGVRVPSEVLPLRWSDVHWAQNVVRITSPKTARHNKHERICPLFPELRTYLEDAFAIASPGAEFVIDLPELRQRSTTTLRNRIHGIIRKAGLTPWPRTWHNMRATRQTELVDAGFGEYAVCAWLGNTPKVANAHYLRVTPELIAKAAGVDESDAAPSAALHQALQHGDDSGCTELKGDTDTAAENPVFSDPCDSVQECAVTASSPAWIGTRRRKYTWFRSVRDIGPKRRRRMRRS